MSGLACVSVLASRMPMDAFERFAFRRDDLDGAVLRLRAATGASQLMLLSTCERVELYAIGAWDQGLAGALFEETSSAGRLDPSAALLLGDAAAEHLLRVTAGLESSVLGDSDVVAQVRAAAAVSRARGVTGTELDRLVATAVHASRRVRRETTFVDAARSVAAKAVRRAAELRGGLENLSVVVVGAGKVAATAVAEAVARGARVTVCNRTRRHAERYTAAGAAVVDLGRLAETVAGADVVVFATASPHRLLAPDDLPATRRELLVLDLGVPRNADPALRAVPGVVLLDLEDLRGLGPGASERLLADVGRAERILVEELDRYRRWLLGRAAAASNRQPPSQAPRTGTPVHRPARPGQRCGRSASGVPRVECP
jgi:glutamyl-tRNA reductase